MVPAYEAIKNSVCSNITYDESVPVDESTYISTDGGGDLQKLLQWAIYKIACINADGQEPMRWRIN